MIKPLTSLRFVFALMVFLSHIEFIKASNSPILIWLYDNIFYEGAVGVGFFYVLSGFILAYNYQERLLSRNETFYTFLSARIARIYPLHFFTLILAIPLSIYELMKKGMDISQWVLKFAANVTLTQSFIPFQSFYYSFNGPSWSIANEFFFYMLFPSLILLLVKSRKTFLTIFIFAIIAVPLMMILLNETVHHYIFYIFPAMRIVDFTIGIVLFQAFKYIKGKGIKLNYTIMELVSVVLLVLVYAYHSHVPEVFRYSVYYWPPIFLLILCFAFQKGRISRMLSNRWLVLLGEISFGFYLFHQLVIRYFLTINGKFVLLESELVIAIGLLFVSLLASYLGYIYIEKPANSLVKKKLIVQKKGLTPDLQIS